MPILKINCNKNFIYVLVYWILEIIFHILMYYYKEWFEMTKDRVQNEYMFILFLNVADLLSVFLVLYSKYSSKKTQKENILVHSDTIRNLKLIFKDTLIPKKSFYTKMIIISSLDYLSRSFYWIAYAITGVIGPEISHNVQKDSTITFDIIMRYIFSIFILKVKVYKHSIVSIATMIVGFIVLLVTDYLIDHITKNDIDMGKTFFFSGILLFRGISFPFEDTIVKGLFSAEYILPESMQLFRGLFEVIIVIIMTPILYFAFNINFQFNPENKTVVITTMVFYTLALFIKAFILLKIIYHFSNQAVSFLIISESLGGSINSLIEIIINKEKNGVTYFLLLLGFIGIMIILFSSLVYDEVIIINKWQLNENVKLGIISRSESEMIELDCNNNLPGDPNAIDNDNEESENSINYCK